MNLKFAFPLFGAFMFLLKSPDAATAADYTLAVDCNTRLGTVSPQLMGFNVIYCFEPDARWQNGAGPIPQLLADLHTGILRYPAGTVVTFYHWTNPTGQGWADSWDPKFDPSRSLPGSETMSLDEYLDVVKARRITPLIGVNMGSGARFPSRHKEGLNEAVAMVDHCVKRGIIGAYYYLDNEPYRSDANNPYTPEGYADDINAYAPALKARDPQLKIVANLHSGPNAKGYDWTRRAVRRAGANIDFVDLHFYWHYNSTSFAAWIAEPHMLHQGTQPYSAQRALYRKIFAEEGFPAIEPVTLEWNISGPGSKTPPTSSQAALMVSEQFIQFISSGMKFATFWPLQWPRNVSAGYRGVLDYKADSSPNKIYGMFRQFSDIGMQQQVKGTLTGASEADRLTHLSLRSQDGKQLTVYLLNKNQDLDSAAVDLDLTTLGPIGPAVAVGFESSDTTSGPLKVHPLRVAETDGHVNLALPRNSFAKVTVSRL